MYKVTNVTCFISTKKDPKGVKYYQVKGVFFNDDTPNLDYQFSTIMSEKTYHEYAFQSGDVVIPLISPASVQGDYKIRGLIKI